MKRSLVVLQQLCKQFTRTVTSLKLSVTRERAEGPMVFEVNYHTVYILNCVFNVRNCQLEVVLYFTEVEGHR